MSLFSYFRISKPSAVKVPEGEVEASYQRFRERTFWGVTVAYTLYYVCRGTLGVVKQPLIDGGVLTAGQLGIIGSAFYFVYAVGKFTNGFIADYCNIRRFMAVGIGISALINLILGILGLLVTPMGLASLLVFVVFLLLWGINGWMQSMGSPPGTISLSRWFPLTQRGTRYSIFSSTPQLGKSISMVMTGFIVAAVGWQWGFLAAAVAGAMGLVVSLVFISDTPESEGLPSVQELSGEQLQEMDIKPTRELQKWVFRHPGIWVIALSTAFLYITQHAVSDWGVLFLQKKKDFSLREAAQIIGYAEAFGLTGNLVAGWLSDRVFGGNRVRPVPEYGVCGRIQLFLQHRILHCGRPDGPGLRAPQGHRRRAGHRGHLQLCRRRFAERGQRLPHRRLCHPGRVQFHPGFCFLDHRLSAGLCAACYRLEIPEKIAFL